MSTNLYVGNLPATDAGELECLLERFGVVRFAAVVAPEGCPPGGGFGVVEMGSEREAASADGAARSLDAMLNSVDGVLLRYDALSSDPSAAPARTFDVREYTAGVKELAAALENMNDVLKSSDSLLASFDWARRMDDFNESADARMRVAAEQSQLVVGAGFRQLWLTVGAVFALMILYRLTGFYLSRRPAPLGGNAATGTDPHTAVVGSGDTVRQHGLPRARWVDGGRQGREPSEGREAIRP